MDLTDFNIQMRKLTSVFPQQKMNDEKSVLIYEKFKHLPGYKFEVLVNKLIQTCKHSPSIAEMLEVSKSLFPMHNAAPDFNPTPSMFNDDQILLLLKIAKSMPPEEFERSVSSVLTEVVNTNNKTLAENLFTEIKETYFKEPEVVR